MKKILILFCIYLLSSNIIGQNRQKFSEIKETYYRIRNGETEKYSLKDNRSIFEPFFQYMAQYKLEFYPIAFIDGGSEMIYRFNKMGLPYECEIIEKSGDTEFLKYFYNDAGTSLKKITYTEKKTTISYNFKYIEDNLAEQKIEINKANKYEYHNILMDFKGIIKESTINYFDNGNVVGKYKVNYSYDLEKNKIIAKDDKNVELVFYYTKNLITKVDRFYEGKLNKKKSAIIEYKMDSKENWIEKKVLFENVQYLIKRTIKYQEQ